MKKAEAESEVKIYTIGEVADILKVSVKTLQRWDRLGMLKASRTLAGRRYYTDEHIARALHESDEDAAKRRQRDAERHERLKASAIQKATQTMQKQDRPGDLIAAQAPVLNPQPTPQTDSPIVKPAAPQFSEEELEEFTDDMTEE